MSFDKPVTPCIIWPYWVIILTSLQGGPIESASLRKVNFTVYFFSFWLRCRTEKFTTFVWPMGLFAVSYFYEYFQRFFGQPAFEFTLSQQWSGADLLAHHVWSLCHCQSMLDKSLFPWREDLPLMPFTYTARDRIVFIDFYKQLLRLYLVVKSSSFWMISS